MIDIKLPLCRGRVITLENGLKHWVRFRYEHLPNLCFWCGRLNHVDKSCKLWLQSKGTLKVEQQQYNSTLKATPYTSSGRDVIVVPGFYDNRHPLTRKEFQEARERAETRVNNPMESENQLAMETQVEMNQANMVTDEGVILVININELPITNELAINAMLLPDEDIDLIPPTAVTVLTDANNNGELKTKETELVPDLITLENLFDIQIKQIDMDLARYDKDQTVKGNSVRAINGRSNSEVSNFVPLVKNKGTRKSAGNQGKNFFAVEAASIQTQNSTNPNPKCSKKPTT